MALAIGTVSTYNVWLSCCLVVQQLIMHRQTESNTNGIYFSRVVKVLSCCRKRFHPRINTRDFSKIRISNFLYIPNHKLYDNYDDYTGYAATNKSAHKKGEEAEPSGGENGNLLSLAEVYINCFKKQSKSLTQLYLISAKKSRHYKENTRIFRYF
jgi:hypothetical protein